MWSLINADSNLRSYLEYRILEFNHSIGYIASIECREKEMNIEMRLFIQLRRVSAFLVCDMCVTFVLEYVYM